MSVASRLLPRPVRTGDDTVRGRRFGLGRLTVLVLHTAALALLVAVVVHIVVVLLVPRVAPVDAWAKLSAATPPWTFTEIAAPAGAAPARAGGELGGLRSGFDPRFGVVACRFNLAEGPASIVAEGEVPFWSLAVFDRRGENVYSLNDRTAIAGRLDLIVVNAAQRARLRETPIEGMDRSVRVDTNMGEGFVLVRALAPDETWAPAVQDFLRGATCERLTLPAAE